MSAAAILLSILASAAGSQDAEQAEIGRSVGPAVVALRSEEGSGTGMLLDATGLILTNAHVMVSPLPYGADVPVEVDGRVAVRRFKRVLLTGVHPVRDLALVRVDLSEHPGVKLRPIVLHARAAVTDDRIHVLGHPGGSASQVLSSGRVTAVNQAVDRAGYFRISARVAPGNSGGPVVTSTGEALGIITFGLHDGGFVAWALPLHDLRTDHFVPLDRRPKEPAKAALLLRAAEDALRFARQGEADGLVVADYFYSLALIEDASNPDLYFKIGMLRRHTGQSRGSAAYLVRALQLQAWPESKKEAYYELGVSLHQLGRLNDAIIVWREGILKYPDVAGDLWDGLSQHYFKAGDYVEAAVCTRAAVRTFCDRGSLMDEMYKECRRRLDADGRRRLETREGGLEYQMEKLARSAAEARRKASPFLSKEAEKLVMGFDGVQKEGGTAGDFKGPGAVPLIVPTNDAELTALFIRSRTAVAKEHASSGRTDKAVEIFEDLVKTYPDHPEAQDAKIYLSLLKKK